MKGNGLGMKQVTYGDTTGGLMYMTLKGVWFNRILSGIKKIEYREGKAYWDRRLLDGNAWKDVKFIRFSNGYGSKAPAFTVECVGIKANLGSHPKESDKCYEKDFSTDCVALDSVDDVEKINEYQIKLGRIVSRENC